MFAAPRPAMMLGIAGLVPAVAACVGVLWGPVEWRHDAATVCATYAAVILSFLGGAWWGLVSTGAAPRNVGGAFFASVLPSLAGWVALLMDVGSGLLVLGLLFLAILPGDYWLSRSGHAPAWWPRLRLPLSIGMAMLALVAGAAIKLG